MMTSHRQQGGSNHVQGTWRGRPQYQMQGGQAHNGSKKTRNRDNASTGYVRPQSQAVQLNGMICKIADANGANPWGLLDFLVEHLNDMSFVNLSTGIHRLAKLAKQKHLIQAVSNDRRLFALQGRIHQVLVGQQRLQDPSPSGDREVENGNYARCWQTIVWSHATLGISHKDLFHCIGELSVNYLAKYQPLELANLLWSFAKCGVTHKKLFNMAAREIPNRVHKFGLVNLSTIAWAFATSGHKPCAVLLKCLSEEFVTRVHEAESQAISNMVWALATARIWQPQIITTLGNVAAQKINSFNIQEISNTAWGIAKAGIAHQQFFTVLSAKLWSDQSFCFQIHPQGVSNILWSLAKESSILTDSTPCKRAMEALLPTCRARLHMFKPQEYSATLLSCAKMSIQWSGDLNNESSIELDTLFAEAALTYSEADLQRFSPRALSSLLQTFLLISKRSLRSAALYKGFVVKLAQVAIEHIRDFEPLGLMSILEHLDDTADCSSLQGLKLAVSVEAIRWCPSLSSTVIAQLATLVTSCSREYMSSIMCAIAQRSLTLGLNSFTEEELVKLAQMCNLQSTFDETNLQAALVKLAASMEDEPEPCERAHSTWKVNELKKPKEASESQYASNCFGPNKHVIPQSDEGKGEALHYSESETWSDLNIWSASETCGPTSESSNQYNWSASESSNQHSCLASESGYQHAQNEEQDWQGSTPRMKGNSEPEHLMLLQVLLDAQRGNYTQSNNGSNCNFNSHLQSPEDSGECQQDDVSSTCSRSESGRLSHQSSAISANRLWSDNDYQDSCCGDYEDSILDLEETADGGSECGDLSIADPDEPNSKNGQKMPQFTFGAGGFAMHSNAFGAGGFATQPMHNNARLQQGHTKSPWDVNQLQQQQQQQMQQQMQQQQCYVQPGVMNGSSFSAYSPSGYPTPSQQFRAWSQEFSTQNSDATTLKCAADSELFE